MRKNFKSGLQNRAVARALARWRKESGLSLAEVSDRVHWSTAKSSMMQNALVPVTEHDVLALALAYGITDEQRRPVLLGAQRAQAPQQFELLGGDPSACVGWTYAEIEAEASYARVVALDVLPPIVRSPEYEAALRAVRTVSASKKDHYRYCEFDRKRVMDHLHNGPTLRLDLVVGEAVLRRPVGGALVMADQLLRLAALAELPGARVQLIPDKLGAFAVMTSFALLEFREKELDDVVYIDGLHGATWLEAECDRQPYTETFAHLATAALTTEETAARLFDTAQQLKEAD